MAVALNGRPNHDPYKYVGALFVVAEDPEGHCGDFTVSEAEIIDHLYRALPAPGWYYADDFYSYCTALGTVVFSNGEKARLVVQSSGVVSMGLWDGSEAILYAAPQWHDPFDPDGSCYMNRC